MREVQVFGGILFIFLLGCGVASSVMACSFDQGKLAGAASTVTMPMVLRSEDYLFVLRAAYMSGHADDGSHHRGDALDCALACHLRALELEMAKALPIVAARAYVSIDDTGKAVGCELARAALNWSGWSEDEASQLIGAIENRLKAIARK